MTLTDRDLDRALEVALDTARRAGKLLREGIRDGFTVDHKGDVDLVTDVDRRSEAFVVEQLCHAFPDHAVVGEEGTALGQVGDGRPVWLVDPLDGTTNFAHRVPWYAVSIALELEGEPVVGVVHAPEMDWDFWAVRGRGAHLGSQAIRVSSVATLSDALVATGFPYDRRTSADNNIAELSAVLTRAQGARRMGVASLDCALTAWGRLDAYWELKLQPWDIAAGALLVREAGGQVTLPDGEPYRSSVGNIAATNGLVHTELLAVLAGARPAAR